ncbi:MAG: ATP phosphoribosyltransferase [Methanobrevibacter boviskoreani]|jgi:ATP phosphoribosyltransferase|uniref:ATP phosphoribosyltransferase n=1 Tax=Methanobrevibacter boviskoreani TaxID=1348249 RepID=UPI0023A91309|nr:ATP phosphoribosyltransferase [Methanobrevibacter boviskoreani]MCI6775354.1 ATP phosphoribosyltransferase [Methanobrevibacter boviskoreani]MCI6929644.1 ATP phosphoribosyltransferase [Methanobrevibacter boviskoreani]MDD6257239.1 ATP phosphoribosyltransferase [Methanobrevibacter boviskoreani]MDY5614399.1 ATP phosphoribosyltransferase [Methanobrevibacter boviskoreani]
MKLQIAIPSKGRISDPSIEILEQAGLKLKDTTNRKLMANTHNPNIDVMFTRASDIPTFIEEGIVDMGITGVDLIHEKDADVEEILDLDFGQTKLVLAVPESSNIKSIKDFNENMRIATEFPNLTRKYLKENGVEGVEIVELAGSTEIAPLIGIADGITDLTSTGTTLKTNHLKIIDTILESTIKLIANKDSLSEKYELVEAVTTSIQGVINASNKKLILMNVHKEDLNQVKDVLPGMSGPTISEILSKKDMFAVQAVVDEDKVFKLVNELKKVGARDILVVPIERVIN